MEILPHYLKFEYLHRDEGNYKIFGTIILHNPKKISAEKVDMLIKENLIDQQYFYPKEVKIPLFKEHNGIGIYFSDWYEYGQISATHEKPTDIRTIQSFIKDLAISGNNDGT